MKLSLRLSLVVLGASHELQPHDTVLQAYTLCMCENFVVLGLAVLGGPSYTIVERIEYRFYSQQFMFIMKIFTQISCFMKMCTK